MPHSPARTHGPRAPWPRPRSSKRWTARPPPSAISARPVPVSGHTKDCCPATLLLRPGWCAPRSPPVTRPGQPGHRHRACPRRRQTGTLGSGCGRRLQRGLATRDTDLLGEAAAQYPDPWPKASAAEDLAVLLTNTARDQAIGHLKTALDGSARPAPTATKAASRGGCRARRRRRHWTTPATRPVAGWESLTDTEQAVSRLVVQGLKNNQVAAA